MIIVTIMCVLMAIGATAFSVYAIFSAITDGGSWDTVDTAFSILLTVANAGLWIAVVHLIILVF